MMQELQIGGTRRRRGAINDMVTGRFCVTTWTLKELGTAGKVVDIARKINGAKHVRPERK
jgi:hypothetical protein